MHKPIKYAEKAVTYTARAAWALFERLNRIKQNPSFTRPQIIVVNLW